MVQIEKIGNHLWQFESIWDYLGPFDIILGPFETIWNIWKHLGPVKTGPTWFYFGPFLSMLEYLGPLRAIGSIVSLDMLG